MIIDIFTCLAQNSAPYANKLRENMDALESGNHDLRYHALCSSEDFDEIGLPDDWAIIPIRTDKIMPMSELYAHKPSVRHAKLLNSLTHYIESDCEIVLIMDCDMVILLPNWDEYIVSTLRTTDIVATPKHDGTPRMFMMAMTVETYRKLNVDWMPGVGKYDSGWIMSAEKRMVSDTGWKLYKRIKKLHLSCHLMKLSEDSKGAIRYLYSDGGKPICAHLGASHKHNFESQEVQRWYSECENIIKL
jgi:hypothetical protein